jgi:hypothetical protein
VDDHVAEGADQGAERRDDRDPGGGHRGWGGDAGEGGMERLLIVPVLRFASL